MKKIVFISLFAVLFGFSSYAPAFAGSNPCMANPCAKNACMNNPCAKNPCMGNPCAKNACMNNPCAKNPCMANPCGKNPCMKNPCGGNPCSAGPKSIRSNKSPKMTALIAKGKKMWNDDGLGTSELSCMNCHEGGDKLNVKTHGGVFPHYVNMTKDIVTLDQMINFCMINPMATKPLDPNSVEMTAMAAYYQDFVKGNVRKMSHRTNPCMKNPCGKNPCGR